jgi:hypothetical protein
MTMRSWAIGAAMMLAAATAALAADAPAATTDAPATGAKASAKSAKHTGCLAAGDEAGEFKLTNVDGGSDEVELVGGKGLKDHVGHKVEVTGKMVSPKSAHGAKSEGGEAGHQHLKVASMKHLAATCP